MKMTSPVAPYEQSLIAIKLHRERVLDLEQMQQIANQQSAEQELQRGKGDVLNYKEGIQELDLQAHLLIT
jgi:hypothetical protein